MSSKIPKAASVRVWIETMSPWLNQSQIAVSSCRLEAAILSTIDLDLTAPILAIVLPNIIVECNAKSRR